MTLAHAIHACEAALPTSGVRINALGEGAVRAVIALCLFVALTITAGPAAAAGALEGTSWRAVESAGERLPAEPVAAITFDGDGRVYGSAGCNRLAGRYDQAGDRLTFGPAATTRMACPPPAMEVEAAVMAAIADTRTFQIAEGSLVLRGEAGNPLLVLVRSD